MGLIALMSLLIIVDYFFAADTFTEDVVGINRALEEYNNAGGNYHFSYRIQTRNFSFPVSEAFASQAQQAKQLSLEVSPIFREVNAYEIPQTGEKEVYGLRLLTGLLFPLLALLVMALGYRYKGKLSILIFVVALCAVANLLYLLY